MKKILTMLAIIALFAISCSTESIAPASDNPSHSAALAPSGVKGGDVDEEEPQEGEDADDQEATDEEADGEEVTGEETTGDETVGEEPDEPQEEEPATPEDVIAEFIAAHFPEVGIASISEGENCHEVKLEDGTQINFNSDLEWTKVSCKHSSVYTAVPESIVPEEITAYVAENYPEQTIMDIKKTGFGWMVTLNNKGKIKFNKDFSIK